MPDGWVYQGGREEQLAEVGLDAASIARRVREVLGDGDTAPAPATSAPDAARAI
jgi:hypothetical protein